MCKAPKRYECLLPHKTNLLLHLTGLNFENALMYKLSNNENDNKRNLNKQF